MPWKRSLKKLLNKPNQKGFASGKTFLIWGWNGAAGLASSTIPVFKQN
jgi:hypothetical protein